MKLLQLGIASLPFIDACVSFNAEERSHFTDTIGVLLILAPHLSQFMTTFTAGEVNLESSPAEEVDVVVLGARGRARRASARPLSLNLIVGGATATNVAYGQNLAVARRPLDARTPRRPPLLCPLHVDSSRPVCATAAVL
jgi:hypothetical protein